jgi:hypothetical protein
MKPKAIMTLLHVALLVLLARPLATQSGGGDELCKCEVVNTTHRVDSMSACECTNPGSSVPKRPIAASEEVFPEDLSRHGDCTDCDASNNGRCTYAAMQVTVTIANCARDCTGHKPTDAGVAWSLDKPIDWWGSTNSSGVHAFGAVHVYTVEPPSADGKSDCGTAPKKAELTFKKKNGQTAYTVFFEFGCGACPASQ